MKMKIERPAFNLHFSVETKMKIKSFNAKDAKVRKGNPQQGCRRGSSGIVNRFSTWISFASFLVLPLCSLRQRL
jgi:hypothetical protein